VMVIVYWPMFNNQQSMKLTYARL
jgi:WD40 repeat protein